MADYLFSEARSRATRFHAVPIFIAAFLVRFCVVWYLLGLEWRYDTGDGYENTFLAEYIFNRTCYMPPGQYLFAGAINQFFAEPQYCLLRIATICLSALVSVNIYRIGRDAFGTAAGIIAGYASVFSLVFMFHSWTFYGTTLATCLCSFFIYYFLRMFHSPDKRNAVFAGIFLGLTIVTRAEMLIVIPFAFLWFLVAKGVRVKHLSGAFTLVLITCAVIFCWTLRNYMVCDKFVLVSSNASVNYFIGNNPLQKGGYFSPGAAREVQEDYLLAGLTYNLEHPGWFVEFFKEKFILYWSSDTWEHPRQLLESRFRNSPVRLFNTSFDKSRLSTVINSRQLAGVYEGVLLVYGYLIVIFWILVLAGFLCSHLFWKESYFLIGVCFASAVLFSLFFSGANRCFVPILPCLYLLMGLGVRFLYQLPRLTGGEVKTLIGKNALVILMVLAAYAGRGIFICHPVERRETVKEVHRWNVLSKGEASVRLIILESQLSYPVKKNTLTDDTFSVWVDEKEIPPLKTAGKTAGDAKYYFKKVEDLLCKNAFVVNLPRRVLIQLSVAVR